MNKSVKYEAACMITFPEVYYSAEKCKRLYEKIQKDKRLSDSVRNDYMRKLKDLYHDMMIPDEE